MRDWALEPCAVEAAEDPAVVNEHEPIRQPIRPDPVKRLDAQALKAVRHV
jgi:hypothetical protein